MSLDELSMRLSSLVDELPSFVRASLENKEDEIMELQKHQLFAGKRADGNDIRPYYSEDLKSNGGFFKSANSAMAYARMKATKIDYPIKEPRQFDAPNLFINGKFHSELGVEFDESEMIIWGMTPYAESIVEKYGIETFGLTDANMDTLMPSIKENIVQQIRDRLNG